jgi:hypothetical protein
MKYTCIEIMLQFFNYGYNFNPCLNLQHEQSRIYTFLKLFFDRKCTFNFNVGCAIIMLTFDFLLFYKNTRNIISQDKRDVFCGLYVPETSSEFLFGWRKNSIWTPKLNLWNKIFMIWYLPQVFCTWKIRRRFVVICKQQYDVFSINGWTSAW